MNHLIRYGAYPGILTAGMLWHVWMVHTDLSLPVATYLPIVVAALAVTALERQCPYRLDWRPDKKEVAQDALFMVLIQGGLPYVLSLTVALRGVDVLPSLGLTVSGWWPDHWPVLFQMLLMMVLADGMRYWLHRVAHEWEPLWRFHAVHHSPQKLYWLNVGRFHPVDKGLQFLLDALPFVMIGVGKEVLALYLVCYAINGFFQHCNIDVRLGRLNDLISGPELHRWHHSKWKQESNHHYGNNLIIWDRMFGTRYFPEDRQVEELGLLNRRLPMTFIKQLVVPFKPGADKEAVAP